MHKLLTYFDRPQFYCWNMFLVANVKEPSVQIIQQMTTSSLNFNETMSQHIFAAMKSSWFIDWWGGGGEYTSAKNRRVKGSMQR